MNELQVINQEITYNKEQVQLIKDIYAKKATNSELELLFYMSKKYGLDILTKQIWCVKFGEAVAQIYAGRDGFLEIGHRSRQFNGMDTKTVKINEPFSVNYVAWENNKKVNKVFESEFQYVSTCTVFRKDMDNPISVEVYEEEYSTGQNLWQTKRRTMIAKVAESQCLRKAFSISGMYAEEEIYRDEVIDQRIIEEIVDIQNVGSNVIDENKVQAIKTIAQRKGIKEKTICDAYQIDSFTQMTVAEWTEAVTKLESKPDFNES